MKTTELTDNQIGLKRLMELAEHLRTGTLGHKVFDFTCWNDTPDETVRGQTCGTNGCAIGECPILWPNDWEFGWAEIPTLTGSGLAPIGAAIEWFGITSIEARGLFTPQALQLPEEATKEQVSDAIEKFVTEKLNQQP